MRLRLATAVLLVGALAACGDPSGPQSTDRYIVKVLSGAEGRGLLVVTETSNGVTTDRDVTGTEITLDLAKDGTTAGRMFVPRAAAGVGATSDQTADLAGTWSQTGNVVTLRHAADTFLRDMPLTVAGETLVGDKTFGSTRIRLTLARR